MSALPKDAEGTVDPKLPWWGGDWSTFQDYSLRVELKADATKKEDLPQLGPRLATNLIGKAFDALGSLDREALRKEDGWSYLLKHLEKTRGKNKVDLLGDAFTELFAKKEIYRKDGEEMSDYESGFRILVRKVEKALGAVAQAKMPSEVFGWFLLNVFMRLDPSDVANIRGKASSYALEDILAALNLMWSGDSLVQRDADARRRRKDHGSYMCEENGGNEIFQNTDEGWLYGADDHDETMTWYQDAKTALLAEPDVLANFRDARRALDQARTARGYYPVRNPNYSKGEGKGYSFGKGKSGDFGDRTCMRCGKRGHIARFCPQRPAAQKGGGRQAENHFAGFVGFSVVTEDTEWIQPTGWELFETSEAYVVYDGHTSGLETVLENTTGGSALAATIASKGCAIIDSGASENIIGEDTLQELAEHLREMDFDPNEEIEVDRRIHKQFTYGNNLSSAGLGLSHVNAGICGQDVEIQAHMVEGATPFLLSAKFLYDMDATINFRTGWQCFGNCLKSTFS